MRCTGEVSRVRCLSKYSSRPLPRRLLAGESNSITATRGSVARWRMWMDTRRVGTSRGTRTCTGAGAATATVDGAPGGISGVVTLTFGRTTCGPSSMRSIAPWVSNSARYFGASSGGQLLSENTHQSGVDIGPDGGCFQIGVHARKRRVDHGILRR